MDAIKCPKCGSHNTEDYGIYDEEALKGGIYAYRRCQDCGFEYTNVYLLAEQIPEEDY